MDNEPLTESLTYLSPSLSQLDEPAPVGQLKPVPTEKLCESLAALWGLDRVSLEVGTPDWREQEHLLVGLGEEPISWKIASAQLEGALHCLMSQTDLEGLFKVILKGDPFAISLKASEFHEGFVRFLSLALLDLLATLDYPEGVRFQLEGMHMPSQGPALCYPVSLLCDGTKVTARLALTTALVSAFRAKFVVRRPLTLAPDRAKALELEVALLAGSVSLSSEEWQALAVGDFVALDQCGVDETGKGSVTLTTEGKTLLAGEVTLDGLRLTGNGSHAL